MWQVRGSGFGLAYNLSMMIFAAFAPNINDAMFGALSKGGFSGSHPAILNATPCFWYTVALFSGTIGLYGLYEAVRTGVLSRVSTIREETLPCTGT